MAIGKLKALPDETNKERTNLLINFFSGEMYFKSDLRSFLPSNLFIYLGIISLKGYWFGYLNENFGFI
jgi:hypothetical protein